jgi:Flp pilus assembly protein TadG
MTRERPTPGFLQRLRRFTAAGWRRLARDEGGATAVEFGILALPFFSIVAAIMQTAMVFLASQVLESAVNDASRTIRTGQIQTAGGTIETFRTAVCDRLFGLFNNCDNLHIRVISTTQFQSATVVVPVDPVCEESCNWTIPQSFSPGVGRDVVLAQVFFRYPVIVQLGPFGMSNLGDGSRLLGAVTVFQNEPFSG